MATTPWGGHVLLVVYIGLSALINLTESRNGLDKPDDYDKILGYYASCMCPSAGLIALVIHGVWLFRRLPTGNPRANRGWPARPIHHAVREWHRGAVEQSATIVYVADDADHAEEVRHSDVSDVVELCIGLDAVFTA
ncbi:unnamed protein product, partial [Mesorhabditis spiculigera]